MTASFVKTFGKPRLVAAQGERDMTGGQRGKGSDAASGPCTSLHEICALPAALVDQLADALGVAEARCAATQRMHVAPGATAQPVRLTEATPYVNAESAPFLRAAFPSPHGAALSSLPAASAADQWMAQHGRQPQHATGASDDTDPHHADPYHDDALELPRFFERSQRPSPLLHSSTSTATATLSPPTMACGFVIGLAVIVPALWVLNVDKISDLAKHSAPLALTAPMLTASAVATLVPSAAYEIAERGGAAPTEAERSELAQAAFEEANRRIAAGDYIGARDKLQQAVDFGAERARALLDALD
jgi:hypothetical protein